MHTHAGICPTQLLTLIKPPIPQSHAFTLAALCPRVSAVMQSASTGNDDPCAVGGGSTYGLFMLGSVSGLVQEEMHTGKALEAGE